MNSAAQLQQANEHFALCEVYVKDGDFTLAEAEIVSAIMQYKRLLAEDDPKLLAALNYYGLCLYNTGKAEKAVAVMREMERVTRRLFGENSEPHKLAAANLEYVLRG
ncbi:MAG: hypothetical protein LBN97_08950 [Oscillospiraceae bacterium]|jgi:tetratricopeptide (TPR) repeat protein|nr:hypothetical protein [Oscillospiraceae bacterium]